LEWCVDEYGDLAKDIFYEWSKGTYHENYQYGALAPENFDEEDIESQWKDWIKRKSYGKTGYTFGTVRWYADNSELSLISHDDFSALKNQKILVNILLNILICII
jgi:hypothetical protein